ncbi:MAG: sulfatase [Chitinophagaceae bacterium]|nr:sulfatase [Chitinophagaceae bacterium]MCW5928907.1 sulfatase [Chitinophagaceae bacterium]
MKRINKRALIAFLSMWFIVTTAWAQQVSRPNIIFFLVDDLGWNDLSLPISGNVTANNKKYHTPHIEQLAKEGIVFTDAYTAPVCTPTRVSLITGVNAARHHVTNWTSPQKDRYTDAADEQFDPPEWNINGFSPEPGIAKTFVGTPLPAVLRDHGYFTIHVGKAHWGPRGTPSSSPNNVGFIVNIAGHAAGHPQSYLPEEEYGNIPGKGSFQSVPDLEPYYQTDVFLTDALTREALKAIEYPVSRKQPFFLNLGHYAVHTPIMGDKKYLQKYLDAGLDSVEARYASLVEGVDKSVGDILAYLKQKNIEKNTVFIFTSDNGGLSLAPPRGGESFTHNLPLRVGKGSVYEGGIRVPLIVKYDGVVKQGTVSKNYVIAEDIFPTLLEIAGIRNAKVIQKVDGKSFVPSLRNAAVTDTNRVLIWHYPNKWRNPDGPGINYHSALRKDNWKLVYNQRTGERYLYDLRQDIGETTDVSGKYPAVAKSLSALLGQTLAEYNALMPVDKKTGRQLAYPE